MLTWSWWAFLPPLYSLSTAVGLWVVYFVAVNDGKIAPLAAPYRRVNGTFYVPFISIAGNFPPASCIFSEVMNLAAFTGFIIAVLRYLQLKGRMDRAWLNFGCLAAFSLSCFGMTLVGNFQLFVEEEIHNLGTSMTFGLGVLFCWVQSYITLTVNLKNEGRKVGLVRLLLSGCVTLCIVLYPFLMSQGHYIHSARCQWALVMFFLMFISTFGVEFRHSNFAIVCTDYSGRPIQAPHTFSELSTNQQQE